MPIFDYMCLDCGKTSEILVTGSEADIRCASCQGKNLKKLISAHSSLSGPKGNAMPGPGAPAPAAGKIIDNTGPSLIRPGARKARFRLDTLRGNR